MARKPHLVALTSLRFFAAFGVLLYHYAATAMQDWPSFIRNLVHNGSAGVPFFFMLSGFVLAYTYDGVAISPQRFWWLRFARVYPVYILSLLVALPPYLTDLSQSGQGGSLAKDIITRTFLLQMWFPGEQLRWNGPAWSLSCEAFFYLLFPLLAVAISRLRAGHLWIAAASIVTFAHFRTLATLVLQDSGAYLASTPIRHSLLFVAGICICRAYLAGVRLKPGWFVGATLLALCLLGGMEGFEEPWSGALLTLAFALMILSGASVQSGPVFEALARPSLLLLGEASYALYILHEPLGSYLHYAAKKAGTSMAFLPVLVSSAGVAVLVSILVHRKLEIPVNRYLRTWRLGN